MFRRALLPIPFAAMLLLAACGNNSISAPAASTTGASSPAASVSAQDALTTATPIKHVVVIFGENVSFDHYFGTYPQATNPVGEPRFTAAAGTPTLRNVAERKVFFHNGVYHDLRHVMDFYNLRDTAPDKIYPRDASGKAIKYDDLPPRYHANIDVADAPFDRKFGDQPAMTDQDIQDIIAFLKTLSDGYSE
ncbi:hypothetical protein F0160_15455 [Paraburkholderia sp. JPY303]|uniref:alkaline phosphatase family protein n=1 Tax=Paraburkholderia atlantica TaxID=2654982 RepID=UPI003F627107|nr:hypothetical protein [Paraburkholderia atlantica]